MMRTDNPGVLPFLRQHALGRVSVASAVLALALAGAAALAQVPAPTGLIAERVPGGPCVTVAWIDNARNEGGYEVHRSDPAHADAVVASLPADSTTYQDCTADPAQTAYTYGVRALPLHQTGANFGLPAGALAFDVERAWPALVRIWTDREEGLPVSGYCTPHAPTYGGDPTAWDCFYPFPASQLHYRIRSYDGTSYTDWGEETHLQCRGPNVIDGGCRCGLFPAGPWCLP